MKPQLWTRLAAIGVCVGLGAGPGAGPDSHAETNERMLQHLDRPADTDENEAGAAALSSGVIEGRLADAAFEARSLANVEGLAGNAPPRAVASALPSDAGRASLPASPPSLPLSPLKPGKFLWRDDPPSGRLGIVISLGAQMLYVLDENGVHAASTISSGRRGYTTPDGTFEVLQKKKRHFSNKYDNAPMPFMQRLTWTGVALHAGYNPGHPASHGCIRLPMDFARRLFRVTRLGTPVVITNNALPSSSVAVAQLRDLLALADGAFGAPEAMLVLRAE